MKDVSSATRRWRRARKGESTPDLGVSKQVAVREERAALRRLGKALVAEGIREYDNR